MTAASMAQRACQRCGANLEGKRADAKWCSPRCCTSAHYHRDKAHEHRKRKAWRLRMDDEKYRQYRDREERWRAQNQDRYKKAKSEWHRIHHPSRWPLGLTVWHLYAGWWCRGTIVGRPNNSAIVVRLDGGTEIRTSARKLLREKPEEAK